VHTHRGFERGENLLQIELCV